MSAVQLKHNCSSDLLLPKVRQESFEITQTTRKLLGVGQSYKLTKFDSFKICLPPGWVCAVKGWLNRLGECSFPWIVITDKDFRVYLFVEMVLRHTGLSFSDCLQNPPDMWIPGHAGSYLKVQKAISLDKSNRAAKGPSKLESIPHVRFSMKWQMLPRTIGRRCSLSLEPLGLVSARTSFRIVLVIGIRKNN